VGRADVASVDLIRPVLEVHIAASTSAASPTPDAIVAYRSVMEEVARFTRSIAPNALVAVEDGTLDLYVEGIPRVDLRSLFVHVRTEAGSLTVVGSAACNFWNHLQIDARIGLLGSARSRALDVCPISSRRHCSSQAVPQPFVVALPSANLHAEARTDGRASIDASFSGDIPSLQVARGERHLELAATSFKGNALLTAQLTEVRLTGLRLGDFVADGEASLRVARGAAASELEVRIPALELSKLRDAAVAIDGDDALFHEYAPRVKGGVVTDLHFAAKANALDELFVLQNMAGSVTFADGRFIVPELEREVTQLSGEFELRDGKLRSSGVSAHLGQSRVSEVTRNTFSPRATRPSQHRIRPGPAVNAGHRTGLLSKSDRESIAPMLPGRARSGDAPGSPGRPALGRDHRRHAIGFGAQG
jgi:hypothetical protein